MDTRDEGLESLTAWDSNTDIRVFVLSLEQLNNIDLRCVIKATVLGFVIIEMMMSYLPYLDSVSVACPVNKVQDQC